MQRGSFTQLFCPNWGGGKREGGMCPSSSTPLKSTCEDAITPFPERRVAPF